jgi:hypothetical protein
VCYIAKGYAQCYGIDYDETTAPTAHLESICSILHIASTLDWDIQQFNIKTTFLHGILPETETMYMEQPPGFVPKGKEDWVMHLLCSIYGMKQASQIWNQTFHNTVTGWGFKHLKCEWCIYIHQTPSGTVIFVLHMDDIISAASSKEENDWFKEQLKAKWDISNLSEAKFTLGIAINCNHVAHTICLLQMAQIDHIVPKFNQTNAHPVDTPMVSGLCLE